MNYVAEDILMHYGVSKLDGAPGPGSGRYPLGSGEDPFQKSGDFASRVEELRKNDAVYVDPDTGEEYHGDQAVYRIMKLNSTTQLRTLYSLAKDNAREEKVATAQRLRDEGHSLAEIAKAMGYSNDSSVRSLLNKQTEAKMKESKVTADFLKDVVDSKGMIDVGAGVEMELGVSKEKLKTALTILQAQGYEVYAGRYPQATNPGQFTTFKVLCPPGTQHKEIFNPDNIHYIRDYDKILADDGTVIKPAFRYPESLDSKRLQIVYAEQGGTDRDGLIELRRGVPDISLGESHYSQVRIMVDGTHYLKGMAAYADDLPDGIDVRFNTNKKEGTPALGPKDHSVLKPIKTDDPMNPFGSLIKEHGGQSEYEGADGKMHLSLINKRSDEGDWDNWNDKTLPSQFLAKQPLKTINKQIELSIADKAAEFEAISNLTNPTVKRRLLMSFAEDCDSTSVHLQAAGFPRQKYQVILPLKSISDKEVYAPNFNDGEKVALIRFPHGHTSEIAMLTVNNKNKEGKNLITPNAKDAVGINSAVAARLSGADFDGDTVLVIPCGRGVNVKATSPIKGLADFDPKVEYGPDSTDKPYPRMKNTQNEMGRVSNLIMDMTLKGASEPELVRAIKHSMVVIDAEKHNLDYKRSEKVNQIDALKRKYQKKPIEGEVDEEGTPSGKKKKDYGGASTLITRAGSQAQVDKRKGNAKINPDGSLRWDTADDLEYIDKKGRVQRRHQKSTQMAETSDARTLISEYNTAQEIAYADYANKLKSLANSARKMYISTKGLQYDPSARKTYQAEVDSLESQLRLALQNAPRERKAQLIANSVVSAQIKDNPGMTKEEVKKANQRALASARTMVGAKRHPIEINDREWNAIQAGAITNHQLEQILKFTDTDAIRKRATPKASNELSDVKVARIKAMKASGYTNAEIAARVGVSSSTVSKYL